MFVRPSIAVCKSRKKPGGVGRERRAVNCREKDRYSWIRQKTEAMLLAIDCHGPKLLLLPCPANPPLQLPASAINASGKRAAREVVPIRKVQNINSDEPC